jgi:DNA polymerase elongation subunit (family B)
MEFQILDWNYYHNINSGDGSEEIKEYVIRLFGRTSDNKTIYIKVNNYNPFFYVEIEKTWPDNKVEQLLDKIRENIWPIDITEDDDKDEKKVKIERARESLLQYENGKYYKRIDKYKFYGFTNFKKFHFLELKFKDFDGMRSYINAFRNKKRKIVITGLNNNKVLKFNLFESNLEPYLRCMHILDLEAVGWAKIEKGKYQKILDETSNCQISIEANYQDIIALKKRDIMPWDIASFDIECKSEDGSFPQPQRKGDKIIQIGTTFSRFGENDCYYKNIITLNTCAPIDNCEVISCKTERELLLKWGDLIWEKNPDIITGYNIFGFDFEYIYERAKILNIEEEFANKLSRVIDQKTEFKEKKLASSALGDNIMKYYDMIGRVIIDMMKVVQRDYKLASYKLDYVASYFIKEGLEKIIQNEKEETTELITKGIYGVEVGQYITVNYNDAFTDNKHMDGKKFKILELKELKEQKKYIIKVHGIVNDDIFGKGYKIFWCQAKDDVSPQDIFRLQDGTSEDRAIIAKYCIMDCALCNKLMAKLQVLTNNIGMANVCHVPLSYLFMRGQGIKIFSLVARKCRIENHLIPVLKAKKKKTEDEIEKELKELEEKYNKKENLEFERFSENLIPKESDGDDEDDEEQEGYEGATVFDPKVGVHYDPVPVLDYNSLYPSAMILKNLSHEYFVNDEKYGNLEDYNYHLTTYLTSFITENVEKRNPKVSLVKFREWKKKIMNQYNNSKNINKYIIEEINKEKTQIYDKNNDGTKKFLICEIILDKEHIKISKYETAKFAEKKDGSKGIIPQILQELLDARKRTRKEQENEPDKFKASVLDGLQLAYKVTANSLYGQTGSATSAISMREIAASTTATGRQHLEFSRDFLENEFNTMINMALTNDIDEYKKYMNEIYGKVKENRFEQKFNGFNNREEFYSLFYKTMREILDGYKVNVLVIYGDTDSTFFKPQITNLETGEIIKDKKALEISIKLGNWSSHCICLLLTKPMNMAYEKVLYPFIILTKKRYVGNLYENDPNKFYQKSMGIVLKRRDNAPIVKIVCGGIVDQLLNKKSSVGAVEYTRKVLREIIGNKFPIEKFIITKTLRENYKDRTRIVHAVLADRMAERDPGNKPRPNDRIPYVYKVVKGNVELQGDRVENPDYLIKNKLKIDFLFYITNQIMKPCIQFLELIIVEPEKIFEDYIIREENRRKGKRTIKYFFETNKDNYDLKDNIIEDDIINIDDDIKNIEKVPIEYTPKTIINKKTQKPRKKIVIKNNEENNKIDDNFKIDF